MKSFKNNLVWILFMVFIIGALVMLLTTAPNPLAPARYLGTETPPLQVQWGDKDVITPTRCVDWFGAATPHAEVHVFRGVGHLPMLERPAVCARRYRDFLRRRAAA